MKKICVGTLEYFFYTHNFLTEKKRRKYCKQIKPPPTSRICTVFFFQENESNENYTKIEHI